MTDPEIPLESVPPEPGPEDLSPTERRFARGLAIGVRVALLLLVAAFCAYVFAWVKPHVSLHKLPNYWGLPSDEYVRATGEPTEWQWTARLDQGDVLTIVPAVFLVSLTGLCLLSIVPLLARRRDWVLLVFVLVQLTIITLAAWPHLITTAH